MQNTIIALWGKSDQGKSDTLVKLKNILDKNGFKIEHDFLENNKREVFATFKNDTAKIGVCSQGDPNTGLEEKIKILADAKCNIIVCATRTTGDTVNCLYNFKAYEIIWITNYRTDDSINKAKHNELNTESATAILNLINSLIHG